MILPKSQMTEEDIKLHYITPAILKGWSKSYITMETKITDGKINLRGNFVSREKPKKVDYLLYINANHPIAVVEAKDNKHTISAGLQQAKGYQPREYTLLILRAQDIRFVWVDNKCEQVSPPCRPHPKAGQRN